MRVAALVLFLCRMDRRPVPPMMGISKQRHCSALSEAKETTAREERLRSAA